MHNTLHALNLLLRAHMALTQPFEGFPSECQCSCRWQRMVATNGLLALPRVLLLYGCCQRDRWTREQANVRMQPPWDWLMGLTLACSCIP
jgi:hypothetical protein